MMKFTIEIPDEKIEELKHLQETAKTDCDHASLYRAKRDICYEGYRQTNAKLKELGID